MAKKQVRIVISKDGTIRADGHEIKGKQAHDLMKQLLGNMMIIDCDPMGDSDEDEFSEYVEDVVDVGGDS
tara:strand:+ start:293 stop:502 length:210 start_codon:yes stop_codon:yes gene_type:complete